MGYEYHLDYRFTKKNLVFEGIRILQIGRLYCTPQTVIRPHQHIGWFELTAVTDGKGVVSANGIGIPVKKGDIYLSFPCDNHAISPDETDPLRYDFFSFETQLPVYANALEKIMSTYLAADKRVFSDRRVMTAIAALTAEFHENGALADEMIGALLREIVILIIRNFSARISPVPTEISDRVVLCHWLMNYMDTHIYSMKSLNELSALTSYNYSYLSTLFREHTSRTLGDYYHEKRMETAKVLLTEEGMTVSRVAELLNYSSVYAFSKAFRNKFGFSARDFMKGIHGKP